MLTLSRQLAPDSGQTDALQRAITKARCLVWQAHVYERPFEADDHTSPLYDAERGTYLHWDIQPFTDLSALSWLPIERLPHESFTCSLNRARFPEEQRELDACAREALRSGEADYSQSFRVRLADGTVRWLMESVQIQKLAEGHWELTGVCVDITDRKQAEERLHQVMNHARCLLWFAQVTAVPMAPGQELEFTPLERAQGAFLSWEVEVVDEAAAQRWLPVTRSEGNSFTQDYYWSRPEESRLQGNLIAAEAVFYGLPGYRQEFPVTLESGAVRWIAEDVEIEPVRPGVWSLVGVSTDVTDLRRTEERLSHLAQHDPVTNLPNRLSLLAALYNAGAQPLALLFLDLDNFKVINDSMGHPVGDRVLIEVARRLQAAAKGRAQVIRLGGDEFTLLHHGCDHLQESASQLAKDVLAALSQPLQLEGRVLSLTASIGIVLGTGGDRDKLLRAADMAMYHAKAAGKASYVFFDPEMDRLARQRFELEGELRLALQRQELLVCYQPLMHLGSQQICRFEALVRWSHPTRGMIAPDQFIGIAEEAGLIATLGEQVLYTACRDAARWGKAHPEVGVNVNVSGSQLQLGFVPTVAQILQKTGLQPERLTLEFTEHVLMKDSETNRAILIGLAELGVRLALDDFGTGYSSLSYLSRMPVHSLKIDRSFVSRLGSGDQEARDNQAIIRSVIALGRSLRMEITAEGIETRGQADLLTSLGCDHGQGYYWAKPRPYTEAITVLTPETLLKAA